MSDCLLAQLMVTKVVVGSLTTCIGSFAPELALHFFGIADIDLSSVEERVGSPFWRATFAGAGNHMGQIASSVSIANMFPSVFGSVLPSVPDFGTSITTRHHPYMKKKTADNTRVEISDTNISVLDLDQSYSNAKLNCDGSTINPGSIFQISEIQTDWNLVFPIGSCSKVGNNSEIDGYLSYGFSFPEESGRQVSGKCSNLFENISGSAPFPLFFVEDPASTDEIGEVMGQVGIPYAHGPHN